MKYSILSEIVTNEAHELKENAAYSGSYTDGGSSNLLQKLSAYKNSVILKYDLRPSEFNQHIEVGEPEEFYHIIERYKMKLAEDIVKNMKL